MARRGGEHPPADDVTGRGRRMRTRAAACALLAAAMALTAHPAGAAERMVRWGTGFFVSKSGHVLTNFHVAESCRQLTVQSGHATSAARIVALDPANDLALLTSSIKPAAVAEWRYAVRDWMATPTSRI